MSLRGLFLYGTAAENSDHSVNRTRQAGEPSNKKGRSLTASCIMIPNDSRYPRQSKWSDPALNAYHRSE